MCEKENCSKVQYQNLHLEVNPSEERISRRYNPKEVDLPEERGFRRRYLTSRQTSQKREDLQGATQELGRPSMRGRICKILKNEIEIAI